MLKKLAVIALSIMFLNGCALLDAFNQDNSKKAQVKTLEVDSSKQKPKPKPKPIKPSQVEETPVVEPEEPTPEEVVVEDNQACNYTPDDAYNKVSSIAQEAITKFYPRQPNLTLVYYVTADDKVCKDGVSLTKALKNELDRTDRFNLVSSSLEKKIKEQHNSASNAYLYRIAKAQNIDYVVSGQAKSQGKGAMITIKITDTKTGSVVWQKSRNL